jgi:hypothetical protein
MRSSDPDRRFRRRVALRVTGAVLLSLGARSSADAQDASTRPPLSPTTVSPRTRVTARASGTFEVELRPQPADDHADGAALGRMTIDKRFEGDLVATSKGQMLTGMSSVKGSAGYVAIERVSGTLAGRRGTFVLQHSGTMTRGAPSLTVTVVPDSGTDQLAGLTGTMLIDVGGGRHAYTFDYALPAAP